MKQKKYLLAAFLLACIVLTAGTAASTQAATKKSMKYAKGVSWDLKKGKTVTTQTYYAAVGMKDAKVKLSGWKITKGYSYNTLDVSFTVTQTFKPSKSQVHKIANSRFCRTSRGVSSGFYWTVLDYDTGLSLEGTNSFDVTVTTPADNFQTLKTNRYKDKHGCYVWLANYKVSFSVQYPADYKGLCIGYGGHNKLEDDNETVNNFFNGKISFVNCKTLYSKSNKKLAHFIRVK